MNYSYLTNMNYNAGIYIRLSQEDKDKNMSQIVKVLLIKKKY